MRYVAWTIKLVLFAVLVLFAYKNMGPVDVELFGQARVSGVPLVVVMLVMFVLGTLLGVFLMLPSTWQRRREAARLKRELKRNQAQTTSDKVVDAQAPTALKPR